MLAVAVYLDSILMEKSQRVAESVETKAQAQTALRFLRLARRRIRLPHNQDAIEALIGNIHRSFTLQKGAA